MLGRRISDPLGVEGAKGGEEGLGFLPGETLFEPSKETTRITGATVPGEGFPGSRPRAVEGYEIHMGRTILPMGARPLLSLGGGRTDGAVSAGGRIWGTYLHGIFDSGEFREEWLRFLRQGGSGKGLPFREVREQAFDRLGRRGGGCTRYEGTGADHRL
jgi:adenosylcobyric acid synthase